MLAVGAAAGAIVVGHSLGAMSIAAWLVVRPRTGHMSPLERPDEVATSLSRLAAGAPVTTAVTDGPW
jgi:pimeloyl-ACP methyl ester carboxylesterase